MGPDANVAEHLIQALNVVCGRFPRAGDRPAGWGVLEGSPRHREEARSPSRPWERSPKNRFGASWLGRELMSPMLPREILDDGPDRIRALVVVGANPGAAFPDQGRILEALEALDLLVVVDPFMTETARRADYVIAPTLSLERAEDTRGYGHFTDEPFAQFAAPVLPRPEGVIDDWEFFLRLGQAMRLGAQDGAPQLRPRRSRSHGRRGPDRASAGRRDRLRGAPVRAEGAYVSKRTDARRGGYARRRQRGASS